MPMKLISRNNSFAFISWRDDIRHWTEKTFNPFKRNRYWSQHQCLLLFWITHYSATSKSFREINFTKISWYWFHEKIGTLNWCCNTAQLLFTMTFIYVGNLAASFSIYYCCCYCLLHTGSFLNHLAFWEIFRNIEFAGSLWKKQDPVDLENSMCVNPIWLQIST